MEKVALIHSAHTIIGTNATVCSSYRIVRISGLHIKNSSLVKLSIKKFRGKFLYINDRKQRTFD
jgi:hypothetical protein